MSIPFIDLQAQRKRLGRRLDEALIRVVDHGGYIMGPEVRELESGLAKFCGAKHCISCSDGTTALGLVLMGWEVKAGDAVFVPAFTFASTAEVVAWTGATPVFVDVLEDTFNMDPASLKSAVAAATGRGLTPKAVIPVDLFGQPADYRRIVPVAEDCGLKVLADAAQSFGAELDGRRMGTFGDATSTSFFPAKPLGCYGDGGAVFTDDEELAEILRSLRVHGQGSNKYDNVRIGINGRLDTLQAAILIEKLAIFPDEIEARQSVARRYSEALRPHAAVPAVIEGARSVWAQYTLKLEQRDSVQTACRAAGIPTAVYYPMPLSRQTAYRNFPSDPGGTPVSDALSERVLSIPMHPYLSEPVQDHIIDKVGEVLATQVA